MQLVTTEEAAYPDNPYGFEGSWGSPTASTEVEVVLPPSPALVQSPFHFKVRFKPHGGAAVDSDSIALTYWKVPAIDITQRIRHFIQGDTIDITDAELPAGMHPFRIDVKDNRGRLSAPFFFKIGVEK